MEDGIAAAGSGGGGGGVFLVGSHPTIESALDKTWNEIHTAVSEGKIAYFVEDGDYTSYYSITAVYQQYGTFYVEFADDLSQTQTADGYPAIP